MLPALDYDKWSETKDTLHLFLQIIGKIRLKAHPKQNHWWHVTLYPSVRGLTTGRIPHGADSFEILYDMLDHQIIVSCNDGTSEQFDVAGLAVAAFYNTLFQVLKGLGIEVKIVVKPYENKSTVPFPQDTALRAYDKQAVTDFWKAICAIANIFERFRGRFTGKQTPVHLYWHSFDLVSTRFSGRAHRLEGGTNSDREAYSHEVISVGFWPGDDTFSKAAFYGYAYPEPAGMNGIPLQPVEAEWIEKNGGALAILTYDDMRLSDDPSAALLKFLESVYQGAAAKAGWPMQDLTHAYAE
ncbi:hypothetical protein C1J03_03635 [Sulfitobacter sp. SK012]|uniref:DUF5996 family protein n=1 Tax=Sulfitobacter sp. SK012 TaxID=1389005 RepID=UPI000E0AF429|nr:DUF5996 family protein [Sulfitobacter sp. SK012]AXI45210.1 hypothetical protein C1J03_03635 [Sulfitobacter sp. SK012]